MGVCLHESNPVIDGVLNELSQVGIHDVLEPCDDVLEWAGFIISGLSLEEVVILAQLILDFSN